MKTRTPIISSLISILLLFDDDDCTTHNTCILTKAKSFRISLYFYNSLTKANIAKNFSLMQSDDYDLASSSRTSTEFRISGPTAAPVRFRRQYEHTSHKMPGLGKEYRDDDEDEDDMEAKAPAGGNSSSPRDTKMMQPMAIGVEYTDELREASRWKAKLAAFLSVIFIIIGSIITRRRRAIYYASRRKANVCDGFDANYFSEIMHQVQRTAQESLCTETYVPKDSCRCHNPFFPVIQDRVPGWEAVMEQNIDMLENNYTSINQQPDFVLYGDSITERLLGRNFGHVIESSSMREKSEVAYHTITKAGGGKVNGLPMGISADEVSVSCCVRVTI